MLPLVASFFVIKMSLVNRCSCPPTFTAVQAGRVGHISLSLPSSSLSIWNVHNFSLSSECLNEVQSTISRQIAASKSDPSKSVLFLAGDFNKSRNNTRYYFDPLDQAHHSSKPSLYAQNMSRGDQVWEKLFQQLTEMETHNFTHF